MGDTIRSSQQRLLAKIAGRPALKPFYLAGGTSLALQLGHRLSVDLDFFEPDPFDPQYLIADLRKAALLEVSGIEPGTLRLKLDDIPVSFFEYPYRLLEKVEISGVVMAGLKDVALMKLIAIQQRGLRKDFIDLYAICRTGVTLADLIDLLPQKYDSVRFDKISIAKALVYFNEAVDDVPLLVKNLDWDTVKGYFRAEVRKLIA